MRHKARKAAAALIVGALFVFMLSGVALAAPPWSDATNEFWVHTYRVTDVQVGTVAGGYANGTFLPAQPVTRAEFAKMAVSGLGIATKDPATPTFIDVLPDSIFYPYVEGAYAAGLVKGKTTPAGLLFGPTTDISRQQANSILGRYLSGQEIEATGAITGGPGSQEGPQRYPSLEAWYAAGGAYYLAGFADRGHIMPDHAAGTAYLVFQRVIKGSAGKLGPEAKLSRAQAATMVLRVKGVSFAPTISYLEPTSGPVAGGNTVIMAGNHLTGATAVAFGGTNATSFHVDNDNQITAMAPAHAAETVDVQVTTPSGSSAAAGTYNDYIYTAALPTITLLSPTSGTTAGGTQDSAVIIKGTDLIGATAVMFGTTAATSFWVNSRSEIYAVAPAQAAGTVDVVVTTPNGASVPTAGSVYEYLDLFPSLPLDKPVDLVRRTASPWIWSAAVAGHTVAYEESPTWTLWPPGVQMAPQSAVAKMLDLATGEISAVAGSETSPPHFTNFSTWPWWFLAALPNPQANGAAASLVWGVVNNQYSGGAIPRYQNVMGSAAGGEARALLDPATMTLPPIRTGDVLVLPRTTPAYENAHLGNVGTTLGYQLLILSGSLEKPVVVDPAAPRLPAAALVGISPYVSWFGFYTQDASQFRSDLPGQPPRVFDLRTGRLADIVVTDPRTPQRRTACVVAGHWAAWVAVDGSPQRNSLYLADLATGQARRLTDGNGPSEDITLSEDWLLWTDTSGTLAGFHLPDMTPVKVAGVLASGEYAWKLQVSGDLAVLMVVAPGGDPNYNSINYPPPPRWTAIRVVRLH